MPASNAPGKSRQLVGGKRVQVPPQVRSVRDMIRRHLALDRLTIKWDLSRMLGITPDAAHYIMTHKHAIAPRRIEQFIAGMKLDDFDAHELRYQAAIEAGWQLNKGAKL